MKSELERFRGSQIPTRESKRYAASREGGRAWKGQLQRRELRVQFRRDIADIRSTHRSRGNTRIGGARIESERRKERYGEP